jgi:transcriptional regulator with XRE-family HTH domain
MAHKRSTASRDGLASPKGDLGSRLRELRLRRRASLGNVARAIGTTGQHLSAIERSQIENPGYKTVLALANYYGVPITRLIDDPETDLHRHLSFEQAIEVLRSNASPEGRAAVVLMAQQLLTMGWCLSESRPNR